MASSKKHVCWGFLLVWGFLIDFQLAGFVPAVVAAHLSSDAVSSYGSTARMEGSLVPR